MSSGSGVCGCRRGYFFKGTYDIMVNPCFFVSLVFCFLCQLIVVALTSGCQDCTRGLDLRHRLDSFIVVCLKPS